MFQKIQEMISGKSEAELKAMAQNIAQERGIDLTTFAKNLGINI